MGIFTSENFIMSLLINRMDVIAADKNMIKPFLHDLTHELMVFAIRNQNEIFIKFALFNQFFVDTFFLEKSVRDEILD